VVLGPGFDLWMLAVAVVFPWPEVLAAWRARRARPPVTPA
jgi:hypothetical protein